MSCLMSAGSGRSGRSGALTLSLFCPHPCVRLCADTHSRRKGLTLLTTRIHCFENVNVLIFLVAISEYDQTLYEDSDINRMNEAAGLFESISNSRWFAQSSVILFLNKTDLFKGALSVLSGTFEVKKSC